MFDYAVRTVIVILIASGTTIRNRNESGSGIRAVRHVRMVLGFTIDIKITAAGLRPFVSRFIVTKYYRIWDCISMKSRPD